MAKHFLLLPLLSVCLWLACKLDPTGLIPVASFTITNGGCTAPCDVIFTNTTIDATSFEWDFGDGTPRVTQGNPTHKYELPGDYVVVLTATGDGGTDTERKTVLVKTQTFKKTFGGVGDEYSADAKQTSDGGYILLGATNSKGAGLFDVYLIKTDNLGNLVWERTFGGAKIDLGYSVQQTSDGGYILLGNTYSEGEGESDVYLIKTDKLGNLVWKRTFGGTAYDYGYSVQQTSDGGYILLGETFSEGAGQADFYLVKTDDLGNLVWKKPYGGTNRDSGWSLQQTTDGGYVLFGRTASEGAGSEDFYLVKTDDIGALVWKKTFGGSNEDIGESVQQTTDGGYILLGSTASEGLGADDFYLIKTDNVGNQIWKKTFGGTDRDSGYSVQQTSDGGYILLGQTASEGAGNADFYLIKTDNVGNLTWKKTFGGAIDDIANAVQQTVDGGYIILGYTNSEGAGALDFYLIKTDKDGNAQ